MEKGSSQGALSLDTHTFASRTHEPQRKKYLLVSVSFAYPAVGQMHQAGAGDECRSTCVGSSGQVVQDNSHRSKIYLEYNYLEIIIQWPPKPTMLNGLPSLGGQTPPMHFGGMLGHFTIDLLKSEEQ